MCTEGIYQLALAAIPHLGAKRLHLLLEKFQTAEEVWHAKAAEVYPIAEVSDRVLNWPPSEKFLKEAEKIAIECEKKDITIIPFSDNLYPGTLRKYDIMPMILYFKGKPEVLNMSRYLGIVGTRKSTEYGGEQTADIVKGVRPYNPVIVSGLAYGIDIASHLAALKEKMWTLAVVGSGLDTVYPHYHKKYEKKICSHGGFLSQFPPGTLPDRQNFPQRNALVAALCDALLIVESGASGGSMITANVMHDMSKPLFALPGRVTDPKSEGPNKLIKSLMAELIITGEDIAKKMFWQKKQEFSPAQPSFLVETSSEEKEVLSIFEAGKNHTLDFLVRKSRMPVGKLSSLLIGLEFKGLVKSKPGNRYVKT